MSAIPVGSHVSWTKDFAIVAIVTVGPKTATNLQINPSLGDDVTHVQFGNGDLLACRNATGTCARVVGIYANKSVKLFLRPKAGAMPAPGRYAGTIQLVANEGKSDAASFTIDVTSGYHRALGVGLVALGTLLSLFITVGIRNRMVRYQMLQGVGAVSDRLVAVEKHLKPSFEKLGEQPNTTKSLALVNAALTVSALQKATLIPRAWALDPASFVSKAEFKTRLDNAAGWAVALGHVATLGLERLCDMETRVPAIAHAAGDAAAAKLGAKAGDEESARAAAEKDLSTAIATAAHAIDRAAISKSGQFEPPPDLAALDKAIDDAIKPVEALALNLGGPIGGAAPDTLSSERIAMQVNVLSITSWVVAALLTTMVGSYVMVFSHSDFGRLNDLWLCLFWGLGLPTVTQLSQATPTSVAGMIGVTLPK